MCFLSRTLPSDHLRRGQKVSVRAVLPAFFVVLPRPEHYQPCQVLRQQRSETLFLTCPSALKGIPLMRHYGEQMQRGQPGQEQPATVT